MIENHQKGDLIRRSMESSIGRLNSHGSLTSEMVSDEVEFLSETLGNLRDAGEISNDAYLDAGSIQGGLNLVASLLEQNVSGDEVSIQLEQLAQRAKRISDNYPQMDEKIEGCRI